MVHHAREQARAWLAGFGRGPRRRLLPVLALVLALAGGGALQPGTAVAGDDFCAGDPIFLINGELVQIVIRVPRASLALMSPTNPVVIRVIVPKGVQATLLTTTGIVPEQVSFESLPGANRGGGPEIPVQFSILAPDQGPTTRYPVFYTAESRGDRTSGQLTSGVPGGDTLVVHRKK
jgi:hypothetical protein